jgi:GTPase SAR1 family protein
MITFLSNKARKNKIFIIFSLLSTISFSLFCHSSYSQNLSGQTIARKIENNKIVYDFYKMQASREIDISDLTIWSESNENKVFYRDVFNTFYNEGFNYRVFLLRKGYAKLDKSESASTEEIDAQNYAKVNKLNIWAVKSLPLPSPSPSSSPSLTPSSSPSLAPSPSLSPSSPTKDPVEDTFDNKLAALFGSISYFWMPISAVVIVVIVICFLSINAAVKVAKVKQKEAEKKQREAEKKLNTVRNHAKEIDRTEYIYQDVVLLGSRNCGKTSLVKLWCAPWANIHHIRSTDSWETSEFDLIPLQTERKYDPRFEVDTGVKKVLRLKIHDYPGDDAFRDRAILDLKNLHNAVILCVFDLDVVNNGEIPKKYSKNNSYYSQMFMNSINNHKDLSESVIKAFVVFNKIDLLKGELQSELIIQKLKEVNESAVKQIETAFSPRIEYHAVSAETNKWLTTLLGEVSKIALKNHQKDSKEIDEILKGFSAEIK